MCFLDSAPRTMHDKSSKNMHIHCALYDRCKHSTGNAISHWWRQAGCPPVTFTNYTTWFWIQTVIKLYTTVDGWQSEWSLLHVLYFTFPKFLTDSLHKITHLGSTYLMCSLICSWNDEHIDNSFFIENRNNHGCEGKVFPTLVEYSQVCVQVVGYQFVVTQAFYAYNLNNNLTNDDSYVDHM